MSNESLPAKAVLTRTLVGVSLFGLTLIYFGLTFKTVIAAYILRHIARAIVEYVFAMEFSYIYYIRAARKFNNG